jgi:hypothetical protein
MNGPTPVVRGTKGRRRNDPRRKPVDLWKNARQVRRHVREGRAHDLGLRWFLDRKSGEVEHGLERKRPIPFEATADEDECARFARGSHRVRDEARFADSSFAGDQHRPAATGRRLVETATQRVDFRRSPDEDGTDDRRVDGPRHRVTFARSIRTALNDEPLSRTRASRRL